MTVASLASTLRGTEGARRSAEARRLEEPGQRPCEARHRRAIGPEQRDGLGMPPSVMLMMLCSTAPPPNTLTSHHHSARRRLRTRAATRARQHQQATHGSERRELLEHVDASVRSDPQIQRKRCHPNCQADDDRAPQAALGGRVFRAPQRALTLSGEADCRGIRFVAATRISVMSARAPASCRMDPVFCARRGRSARSG